VIFKTVAGESKCPHELNTVSIGKAFDEMGLLLLLFYRDRGEYTCAIESLPMMKN